MGGSQQTNGFPIDFISRFNFENLVSGSVIGSHRDVSSAYI